MMYTFFKAMDLEIGKSIVEDDKVELAKELLESAKRDNIKFMLPIDVVISDAFSNDANFRTVKFNEMPENWMGMDIGEETQKIFTDEILNSKTIIWNGPMGVFEIDKFSKGTRAIANSLSEATHKGAISIVGGGDSAAAVIQMHLKEKITHISTGGGASLEFLEGKELPGIAALKQ